MNRKQLKSEEKQQHRAVILRVKKVEEEQGKNEGSRDEKSLYKF